MRRKALFATVALVCAAPTLAMYGARMSDHPVAHAVQAMGLGLPEVLGLGLGAVQAVVAVASFILALIVFWRRGGNGDGC